MGGARHRLCGGDLREILTSELTQVMNMESDEETKDSGPLAIPVVAHSVPEAFADISHGSGEEACREFIAEELPDRVECIGVLRGGEVNVSAVLGDDPEVSDWEMGSDSGHDEDGDEEVGSEAQQEYLDALKAETNLHLLQETKIRRHYDENGEFGLFSLFCTKKLRETLWNWTNQAIHEHGGAKMTKTEWDSYIGLELAMSLTKLNEIADFWSEKPFLGQADFPKVMGRSRFTDIRGKVQIYAPSSVHPVQKERDPLWHSRFLLKHLQHKFAAMAVPLGVSALDETSVRTTARTKAKSYMPSKPDKYAIRFYAVVSWSPLYIHTFWDNSSGLVSNLSPAQRYVETFPELRTPLLATSRQPGIVLNLENPSSVWAAMIGHQTRSFPSPTGRRLVVCDNFYTRHVLASSILKLTDGEVRMIGTVRLNLVDAWNKPGVHASVKRVGGVTRGAWELVAAIEPVPNWKELRDQHSQAQKRIARGKRTEFKVPLRFAPSAGYVVFKDKQVVVFYTNDLAETPTKLFQDHNSEEAVTCVQGLASLNRWTGSEVMHRSILRAPAVVVGYNIFMNSVDRADQMLSTNRTQRREKRLPMTIFTWALDLCVLNAYGLHCCLKKPQPPGITLREFKRKIVERLTHQERSRREKKRRPAEAVESTASSTIDSVARIVASGTSSHFLTSNKNGRVLECRLCRELGIKSKARWGCTGCGEGFHVDCFTAYHARDALNSDDSVIASVLDTLAKKTAGLPVHKTRIRQNNSITPLCEIKLPFHKRSNSA